MTKRQQITRLEKLAYMAHAQGCGASEFIGSIHADLVAIEPFDADEWRRLRNRLAHICLTGSGSGLYAVGDDDALPWADDDQVVDDTTTVARIQLPLFSDSSRSEEEVAAVAAGGARSLRPVATFMSE